MDQLSINSVIGICDGFNFILPSSMIAEVVSGVSATPVAEPKIWQRGQLVWHNLTIPVVNFEQIIRGRTPRLRGSHIAVIRGTADVTALPFYGIPTQAMPNEFPVDESMDITIENIPPEISQVTSMIRVRGVACVIPELEQIETQIAADIRAA